MGMCRLAKPELLGLNLLPPSISQRTPSHVHSAVAPPSTVSRLFATCYRPLCHGISLHIPCKNRLHIPANMSVSEAVRGTHMLARAAYGRQAGARRFASARTVRALRLQGSPARWALPRRSGAPALPATRSFQTSCARRLATVEAVSNGIPPPY